MPHRLTQDMTETQFDNGYWYATELKAFAVRLGIPSASRLRKDQLEREIRHFLRVGEVRSRPPQRTQPAGPRDFERGLRLDLPIRRYVNNKETKSFILTECLRIDPAFRIKSGTKYLLNRWREQQIESGNRVTYGDLVRQFIEINAEKNGPLRTKQGRYNNFYSDFMASEQGATHSEVVRAWNELKQLDIPKTYQAWVKYRDDLGP